MNKYKLALQKALHMIDDLQWDRYSDYYDDYYCSVCDMGELRNHGAHEETCERKRLIKEIVDLVQ
jgi:hypothetical protein